MVTGHMYILVFKSGMDTHNLHSVIMAPRHPHHYDDLNTSHVFNTHSQLLRQSHCVHYHLGASTAWTAVNPYERKGKRDKARVWYVHSSFFLHFLYY